ncbi:MAG TPA: uroporphyrinogen decarboxylase family protein [Sedimentisphaerales bacterium]|nr:uroporphyrinogen decarboxylase family protein [Sedimentisphaerales bacterium]
MSSYSHRERVLAVLRHEEPDRIPLDMMGNATMLFDKTYLRLRDYLGFSEIPPVRSGTTTNYYDERILDYFDIDFRRVFLKKKQSDEPSAEHYGASVDPWGVHYKLAGLYMNFLNHPLENARTVKDIENYAWPKAEDVFTARHLADTAQRSYEETDYAIVARNPLSLGFMDRACQLMGMEEFMLCMMTAPEVAESLLQQLLIFYMDAYSIFLDAVGPYVQIVETADDLGSQDALLISPELYRKFLKPLEKQFYESIRRKAPNAFMFRHSDGAIFEIIPDFIEVGVDILNPVQTSAKGMRDRRLKNAFGRNITFHGSIEKMGDSVDELLTEVRDRIDAFAPGGGYIFAPCNHMIDVKPQNVVAMFETGRKYGRYS